MGVPGLKSLWKSLKYSIGRGKGVSPVLSHSTIGLVTLIMASGIVLIGDVWLHAVSSSVIAPSVLGDSGAGDFSRNLAPPANASQAPWRLQQGFKAFLDIHPNTTVAKLNDTMVIVPRDIPSGSAVLGSTIGSQMSCHLVSAQCIINSQTLSFDCSAVQSGASGNLGSVNVTLFPGAGSTSFNLVAAMALPSLFNESSTVLVGQIFQCSGSLRNVTYLFSSGGFNITTSDAIDFSPLTDLWNLDAFPGKSVIIQSALDSVGKSTIWVQGMNLSTLPSVFSDGLSRIFMAFLSGETISTPSIKVFIPIFCLTLGIPFFNSNALKNSACTYCVQRCRHRLSSTNACFR